MSYSAHESAEGRRRAGMWPAVPHYYGDAVRVLLIAAAALMLAGAALYARNLNAEYPYEIVGALIAVGLAALTSPRSSLVMLCNAAASGVGAAVYGGWALMNYETISLTAFVLRISIAIIFLFAFYFSLKTVRAFAFHQIGKRETLDEFESTGERAEDDRTSR